MPTRNPIALAAGVALISAAACGGGDTAADAAVPDAAAPDAAADAGSPDAWTPCPGALYFTVDYVDWDSTFDMFKGIAFATVTQVDAPSNVDETSPNGRVELCLPPGSDADLLFEHADYLDLWFASDADVTARGPITVRGLTPARVQTLFAEQLSLTYDPATAIVIARADRDDAIVDIGAAHDGAFPLADGYTLFANVDAAARTTSVSVTAPGGAACDGRATIPIVAGAIAFAPYACP